VPNIQPWLIYRKVAIGFSAMSFALSMIIDIFLSMSAMLIRVLLALAEC